MLVSGRGRVLDGISLGRGVGFFLTLRFLLDVFPLFGVLPFADFPFPPFLATLSWVPPYSGFFNPDEGGGVLSECSPLFDEELSYRFTATSSVLRHPLLPPISRCYLDSSLPQVGIPPEFGPRSFFFLSS